MILESSEGKKKASIPAFHAEIKRYMDNRFKNNKARANKTLEQYGV
jgi:hypothetical protein